MPVETLEHYTIRCRDLEATRVFYENALGLKVGPRPDLNVRGYWLYAGAAPIVHLLEADATHELHSTGALGHVAFSASDLERTRERLHNMGIAFREEEAPGGRLHQIFLEDPAGIRIELNFRAA